MRGPAAEGASRRLAGWAAVASGESDRAADGRSHFERPASIGIARVGVPGKGRDRRDDQALLHHERDIDAHGLRHEQRPRRRRHERMRHRRAGDDGHHEQQVVLPRLAPHRLGEWQQQVEHGFGKHRDAEEQATPEEGERRARRAQRVAQGDDDALGAVGGHEAAAEDRGHRDEDADVEGGAAEAIGDARADGLTGRPGGRCCRAVRGDPGAHERDGCIVGHHGQRGLGPRRSRDGNRCRSHASRSCSRIETEDAVLDSLLQLPRPREHQRAAIVGRQLVDADAFPRQLVALDRGRGCQGGNRQRGNDERQESVQAERQHTGDHDRERDRQDEKWTQEAVSVDFRDGFFQRRP